MEKNLNDNLRFFDEVRIFEIGKIFGNASSEEGELKVFEKNILGIAIHSKNGFLELKGIVDGLLGDLGLVDWFMPDLNLENRLLKSRESLRVELGDHAVIGYLGVLKEFQDGAILELDLEKISKAVIEEKEYEPLSKFPSIDRDISLLVSSDVRVGDILEIIQRADPEHVNDVDLMDFYQDEKFGDKKSLTFRIVFQADDRTLTDAEVDREMEKIVNFLKEEVDAEIR
jgi:phenylalanyl-tRNA synthetase beta chain